jgi:hypothetical protein
MTLSESRILVARRQRNVRDNLKMILGSAGYDVDTTGDRSERISESASCHQNAILRDEHRAEPHYWLSELREAQGEMREANPERPQQLK